MWWFVALVVLLVVVALAAVITQRRRSAIGGDAREDRFAAIDRDRVQTFMEKHGEHGGQNG